VEGQNNGEYGPRDFDPQMVVANTVMRGEISEMETMVRDAAPRGLSMKEMKPMIMPTNSRIKSPATAGSG